MSDIGRAIFLSYAHEDAGAARLIAEALRSAGLVVWFDEHELRGGDAWDAQIRQKIRECALFLPIISAQTQARSEGYFRREWKLADQRTEDMGRRRTFLVPVCIDDTKDSEADVPDSFLRIQWTRLPGALPTPQFVEHVKRLLEAPPKHGGASLHDARGRAQGEPRQNGSRPAWTWAAVAAVLVAAGLGYFALRQPVSPTAPGVVNPSPAGQAPAPVAPASPELAERAPARPPAADAKSIAVLPLANLSPDKENEFFADGMHDDLITALAKVRDLKVISRTSVLAYRDTAARNLRKIAAELGVATVLEGSVQRAGNRVRLNVQLIDARTDAHLWAETFNKDLTDVFTIQAALAEEITTALKASLTAGERTLIARRPTENQAAYDLYLRARLLAQGIGLNATREDYEAVLALYEQAATADPKFALPHVQASILHGTMFWFGYLDATPERRARVEASLAAAVRLAPDAPETHLARGSFEYTCRNDWAQSIVEYRKAEAGLPNDAQLVYRIGIAHRRLGQYAEAEKRFERAIGLNPSDLNVVITHLETLLETRRYRRVLAEIDRFVAIFPTERRLRAVRLRARYALDGDRPAFLREMAALPPGENDPHGLAANLAEAMATDDFDAAEKLLKDPRMPPNPLGGGGALSYPVSWLRARLAWLRGRPEDARRWADEAIAGLRSRQWMPRQEPGALLGVAYAHAFAGRPVEALRDARAALADQYRRDVYSAAGMQNDLGQILLICGRTDEALAALRTYMAEMYGNTTPDEIRHDPVWSRLKHDPRFEAILRSAQPRE